MSRDVVSFEHYALKAYFEKAIARVLHEEYVPGENATLAILDDFQKALSKNRNENHIEVDEEMFWDFVNIAYMYADSADRTVVGCLTDPQYLQQEQYNRGKHSILVPHTDADILKNLIINLRQTYCPRIWPAKNPAL